MKKFRITPYRDGTIFTAAYADTPTGARLAANRMWKKYLHTHPLERIEIETRVCNDRVDRWELVATINRVRAGSSEHPKVVGYIVKIFPAHARRSVSDARKMIEDLQAEIRLAEQCESSDWTLLERQVQP